MSDDGTKHLCPETGRSCATPEEAQASAERFREIQAQSELGNLPGLRKGDIIYVDTDLYLSHGADDFRGGLAEVADFGTQTSAGKPTPFVKVVQLPDTWHNWEILAKQQLSLRQEFGKKWSHPDPDYRLEFNQW